MPMFVFQNPKVTKEWQRRQNEKKTVQRTEEGADIKTLKYQVFRWLSVFIESTMS